MNLYSDSLEERLNALKELVSKKGKKIKDGFVNLHIHTNESFSIFSSPTEAVWRAYNENIEYFGINDHYSIDGHPEFKEACYIACIKAVFGLEAIAMDDELRDKGIRVNDPNNPGRFYLVGKGITKDLERGSREHLIFEDVKRSIQERNKKMASCIEEYLKSKGYGIKFTYGDVVSLTPHGNATERHVVQALCEKIESLFPKPEQQIEVYKKLINYEFKEEEIGDVARLHTIVREKLVKAGAPCYIEEDRKAFTSVQDLIKIYRGYGAIPTYPIVGKPITEWEEDIEDMLKRVKKLGLYAFDVFDFRTDYSRIKEIIEVAKTYGYPVFVGTEHNTKKMIPLVGEIGKSEEFLDYFRKSARFVLGHQILSQLCNYGFILEDGTPRIKNLHEGFDFYSEIGSMDISKEQFEEMLKRDVKNNRKFFGIGD